MAQGILKRAAANAARVVVGLAASSIGECSQHILPCCSWLPLRCIPLDCCGMLRMSCVLGCRCCGVVVKKKMPLWSSLLQVLALAASSCLALELSSSA